MLSIITDQTAWYNKKSFELETVSCKMNMQHQKGRHKEYTKALNKILSTEKIVLINRGFAILCNSIHIEKINQDLKTLANMANQIRKTIIENGYVDTTYKKGGFGEYNNLPPTSFIK